MGGWNRAGRVDLSTLLSALLGAALGAILVALLFWSGRRVFVHVTPDALHEFLLVVALVLTAFFARSFALTAQDRIIRLELRLRMERLAPALMPRFGQLTTGQLTALRFASDAELPALTTQVLDGKLAAPSAIKQAIQHWQPDEFRV